MAFPRQFTTLFMTFPVQSTLLFLVFPVQGTLILMTFRGLNALSGLLGKVTFVFLAFPETEHSALPGVSDKKHIALPGLFRGQNIQRGSIQTNILLFLACPEGHIVFHRLSVTGQIALPSLQQRLLHPLLFAWSGSGHILH
jgi:hypothetical protein